MSDESHERYEDSAAAYLLGALPELEQRAFERHVMSCPACRDDVERLRDAVEALPRSVTPLDAPAAMKRSIMSAVAEDRRAEPPRRREGLLARVRRRAVPLSGRVRPAVVGAAAALVVAGALAGIGASELLEAGSGDTRIAATVDDSRLAEGSASLLVPEDEDRAVLSVHGVPTLPDTHSNRVYQAWLVRGDEVIPSSVFGVDSEGAGSVALEADLDDTDAVWVTREAAGGSRAPTERPVMEIDLG